MVQRSGVLIETYWNVNSFPAARNMASVGINRNILECKYGSQTKTKGQPMVLIETYWNVNPEGQDYRTVSGSINRNILECKSMHWWSGSTDKVSINRNILECKLHLHPLSRARAWY